LLKKSSDRNEVYRFGTEHGEIEEVKLFVKGEETNHCQQGDRVAVRVRARVNETIKQPRLMVVVRDKRGYNLFGYDNIFAGQPIEANQQGVFSAEISFVCLLQEGDFSITVRLDEHHGKQQFSLVEKQVNALDFKVITKKRRFEAMIDLDGEFRHLDV